MAPLDLLEQDAPEDPLLTLFVVPFPVDSAWLCSDRSSCLIQNLINWESCHSLKSGVLMFFCHFSEVQEIDRGSKFDKLSTTHRYFPVS